MSRSLYENHWGSPTLTLLNILGVLNVLNMLNVLNVLNIPMDASLACWALFLNARAAYFLGSRNQGKIFVHLSISSPSWGRFGASWVGLGASWEGFKASWEGLCVQ